MEWGPKAKRSDERTVKITMDVNIKISSPLDLARLACNEFDAFIMATTLTKDMSEHTSTMTKDNTDLCHSHSIALGTMTDQPDIDTELEEKIYRKFDKYLLPQMALLIVLAYLDRTNIGDSHGMPLMGT